MLKYSKKYWDDVDKIFETLSDIGYLFNRSVLITGASGMIGSAIADILFRINKTRDSNIKIFLACRDKIKLQSRFRCFTEGCDYTYIPFDAAKPWSCSIKPDYVIHAASNSDPESILKHPVETILSNVCGLNSLLASFTDGGLSRFLFISSSEIYGNKNDNSPFNESDYGYVDVLNPRASYPNSKRSGESLCIAYHEEYDLDTVILRPGHIYGPSITDTDSRASAQFLRRAYRKQDIILKSSGSQIRSYCYTLDCASACLYVLLNGKSANAYNISDPCSAASIRDIAEEFAKISGVNVVFENASDFEKRSGNLMKNSSLDPGKILSLGWKPVFSLTDGVRAALESYED